NPLHTAGMAVELITLTSNTPKIQELARRATESLARLDTMIQTTLDTTVFHRGLNLRLELSYFEVMAVVKEVAQNFVEKEGVRCEVAGAPVYGWWSQEAMYRSLENLIGNAVKYGKAGCPIRITVTTSQKTVRLSVHNEGLP